MDYIVADFWLHWLCWSLLIIMWFIIQLIMSKTKKQFHITLVYVFHVRWLSQSKVKLSSQGHDSSVLWQQRWCQQNWPKRCFLNQGSPLQPIVWAWWKLRLSKQQMSLCAWKCCVTQVSLGLCLIRLSGESSEGFAHWFVWYINANSDYIGCNSAFNQRHFMNQNDIST